MEDVLEVYPCEYQGNEVLVWLDEASKQLVGETLRPLPSRPGSARAYDYEYQLDGLSKLFMLLAPLEGGGEWRWPDVEPRPFGRKWCTN